MIRDIIKNIFAYKPNENYNFELLENEQKDSNSNNADVSNTNKDNTVPNSERASNTLVSPKLAANLDRIKTEFDFANNNDIKIRNFKIAQKIDAFIIYIDGMVDKIFISDFIIRPLMKTTSFNEYFANANSLEIYDYILSNIITANEVSKFTDFSDILIQILIGNSALFIEGSNQCIIIDSKGFEKRSVEKPTAEGVILGSQEGFTENMRTNTSLIRRIVKNQKLKAELLKISRTNQAFCTLMYIDGIVNPDLVNEAKRRLTSIDTDFISGGGMLSQYIEDHNYSIFPQVLHTERPDRTARYLSEGRIAIITEGSPFICIAPVTLFDFIHAEEDKTLRWQYGAFLRIVRILGMAVTVLAPALYIAISLFHHEAIPTELLIAMSSAKEEVPFPTVMEILMLEFSFELIREGGIRVPGVIGQTLGIVGALILGQAAVAAKLVSPILIIVVAITGLGSFAIPNYSIALGLRMLRFLFILLASLLGFLGITQGIVVIGALACSMKSFGVPFLSPIAPTTKDFSSLLVRKPMELESMRPDFLNALNKRRQNPASFLWKKKGKKDKKND
ncbi:spore germination protein [Clostridium manihotivorum]|uniref:Spore germination protein n=1 Tax=Clostridium manihotivorum TaxID=2320868 RepID=A0A410DPN2_9CLOT|nr:spore germination protein [Clostridium manihotivorum]QAA31032.1 spore germination protein [Clostridium manihotivorum]